MKLSTSWIRSSSSQLGRKLFWPQAAAKPSMLPSGMAVVFASRGRSSKAYWTKASLKASSETTELRVKTSESKELPSRPLLDSPVLEKVEVWLTPSWSE